MQDQTHLPQKAEEMDNATNTNGFGSHSRQSSFPGLSLTEYSTKPRPEQNNAPSLVPEQFMLPNGYPDYLRLILTSKVYDVVDETPLTHAVNLSNRLECQVLLKREDLQPVFSFKLRGAYNKMAHLDKRTCYKGVVACSAGNHAQGVAYSAKKLKMPATIIMPEGTPSIKHKNVTRLGGSVVLFGPDFDAAKAECYRREKEQGLINIPPFDDPYVIAGQGTIGMELLRQTNLQQLEAIFCCVGGGGLIAGIGVYVKRIAPHVKVIGVEAFEANAMVQSLAAGHRVTLPNVGLFADGAAVKSVGEETFRICQEVVDQVIQVSTDEICAAIKDVFEDTRSIVEPAGALALAGLKNYVAANPSSNIQRQVVAIASGANMNFDRLRFVAERAALGEGKEALVSVSLPEKAGSYSDLIEAIMPHDITEVSYRFATTARANILLGISLVSPASQRSIELEALFDRIKKEGMIPTDISGDELAKAHIRYMVGGRSGVANERLYMFNFPERPRALYKFLGTLRRGCYDVSIFHYRNGGSDIGEVLTGIICAEENKAELATFLKEIGYPYMDMTENQTFKTFLRE